MKQETTLIRIKKKTQRKLLKHKDHPKDSYDDVINKFLPSGMRVR